MHRLSIPEKCSMRGADGPPAKTQNAGAVAISPGISRPAIPYGGSAGTSFLPLGCDSPFTLTLASSARRTAGLVATWMYCRGR